jgi:hypothetical protein
MTRPIIRIHDITLDVVTDREMTEQEFAEYEIRELQRAEQSKLMQGN